MKEFGILNNLEFGMVPGVEYDQPILLARGVQSPACRPNMALGQISFDPQPLL